MNKMEILLLSKQNIFNLQDLATLWQISEHRKVVELAKYYLRTGRLFNIKKGVYALNKDYSDLELAQKLIPLSYLTYHTALSFYGINYQFYNQIHSTALISRTLKIADKSFFYHKIKPHIFYNSLGLVQKENYTICSKERTICETFLFASKPAFDYVDGVDKNQLIEIAEIFENQSLLKKVNKFIKIHNLN